MLMYATSFFLIAAADPSWHPNPTRIRGFACAVAGLIAPFARLGEWGNGEFAKLMTAVVIVGWVNPLFLGTIALAIRKRRRRAVAILRTAIVAMLAFSWFIFYYEELLPREGFFLWVAGILVVLFSDELASVHAYFLGSRAAT